jgi:hypothetical protein
MEFERKVVKIQGVSDPNDKQYAEKVDLSDLEHDRIKSVDGAFKYLETRYVGNPSSGGPALVIAAFAIGSISIGALWILSNMKVLPF